MCAAGRVEQLAFGCVFGVQLDSLEKKLVTFAELNFTQNSVIIICTVRVYPFIPRRDVLALPWGPIDSLLGYCSSERNLSLRFWAGNPPFLNPIFFYSRVGGLVGIIYHLQFSLYFVRIHIMYISTYICNQNLSPKFLWVSKFDFKLGVIVKNFKITAGRWLHFFDLKVHFWNPPMRKTVFWG